MTPVRVLVVDDEKPARERLRRLAGRDERLELAGCCASGAEALDVLRDASTRGRPIQVLLLDVQMPGLDGFGVVASLLKDEPAVHMPAVVFVTAHDAFALKAFEAHALDYLLKPFSDERFQAAVDRAVRDVRTRDAAVLLERMQAWLTSSRLPGDTSGEETNPFSLSRGSGLARPALDRIVLKTAHRVRLLPVEQITWIEAEGMYVNIHTRDGATHLHRASISTLEDALESRRFIRIHRSAIVNLDVVGELRQDAHGDFVAVLRGGTEVRVGRRFRARLQERLGQAF